MPSTAARTGHRVNSYRDTTPRYSDADLAPLLKALAAGRDGKLRTPLEVPGDGAVAEACALVEELREVGGHLTGQLGRVRQEIGREGHLRERLLPSPR